MLSRFILTLTAVLLLAAGLSLDFLPQETAAALRIPVMPAVSALIQVLAAAFLGLGFLNWFSRGNPMGGIYSRPLALCNLLLFAVSGLSLTRAALGGQVPAAIRAAALAACLLSLAYIWLMFFHDPTAKTDVSR